MGGQHRPADVATNVETAEGGAARNRNNPAPLVPVSPGAADCERSGDYHRQDTEAARNPTVRLHGHRPKMRWLNCVLRVRRIVPRYEADTARTCGIQPSHLGAMQIGRAHV